jgi:hypothetical protein
MKTAMQELRSDLVASFEPSAQALEDITDIKVRKACQMVVKKTIDVIIKRIDDELLEMEKNQMRHIYNNQNQFNDSQFWYFEEFYSQTFKQTK